MVSMKQNNMIWNQWLHDFTISFRQLSWLNDSEDTKILVPIHVVVYIYIRFRNINTERLISLHRHRSIALLSPNAILMTLAR